MLGSIRARKKPCGMSNSNFTNQKSEIKCYRTHCHDVISKSNKDMVLPGEDRKDMACSKQRSENKLLSSFKDTTKTCTSLQSRLSD